MSMNVGSSASDEPEVLIDINTTPLIDVMMVLLVMLIITIPIQLNAVNLEMPMGVPLINNIKPPKIQIDIDERSIVYWQGLPVSAQELEIKMTALALAENQPEVHLRTNKAADYAVFAKVLSSTKRLGLNKIAVIGHEQFVK